MEFFSFDSWFTVSVDVRNGKIQQYYCNINEPAKIEGNTVSFVDLDLDLIQRNGEWMVVDEDEFERNSVKFSYPDPLIQRAKLELASLQARIHNKEFPFEGSLERFIDRIPTNDTSWTSIRPVASIQFLPTEHIQPSA
ncbi:DUF402 domain-containing protein [Cohnella suwonensis]|uniref:DUF402 domain-containing protein n=1 Tax=Cohnella suwonensis TaxID=696072 RepID=A0ABW0M3Q5_9BACL